MLDDTALTACAALVERGDSDRFLAAMSCAPAARAVLFPLYALNLEVARAPWVTQEPLIARMRLQWWRDALAEMEAGAPPRAHEVAAPLARVVARAPQIVPILDQLIVARHWDIEADPFADEAAMARYLDETTGGLVWASALALGAEPEAEAAVRARGRASGVANWLLAVPALEAAGKVPLLDGRPEGVRALAQTALSDWQGADRHALSGCAPALRCTWRAPGLLRRAIRAPGRVASGNLAGSEAARRASLIWRALRGA